MSKEIDTLNRFVVGSAGGGVVVMAPPRAGVALTRDDALNLAAYLVCCADTLPGPTFDEVLDAVRNT